MAFSAPWLRLREPADHAARAGALTALVARLVEAGRPKHGVDQPLHVLDLATGTGSNGRYVLPRLHGHQRWRLVDRDAHLLGAIAEEMRVWGAARGYAVDAHGSGIELRTAESVHRLAPELRDLSTLDAALLGGCQLVTAAALLDLVSEGWIESLAARCRETGAVALFALTYDGRIDCTPRDVDDETVRALVNMHQRRDKGFGPAVGPDGPTVAERCFAALGYEVGRAPSDWVLGPDDGALQRELVDGWAAAAAEMLPGEADTFRSEIATSDLSTVPAWRTRRLAHIAAGRSQIRVGHEDLAAWLP
jgi:hypothetical protein